MSVYTLPERMRYCSKCQALMSFFKGLDIPFTCPKCDSVLAVKLIIGGEK